MALDDMRLLREYASGHSEEAFSALVSRYINLVYSAALRSVNNPHQVEEITQAVFVLLARKAGALRRETMLSGWLYQTARLTAANFLRTELRRAHREQEAHMQSTLNESDPDAWLQVRPLLDDAMAQLNEKDRNAIVLRFFEGKPLKEVAMPWAPAKTPPRCASAAPWTNFARFFSSAASPSRQRRWRRLFPAIPSRPPRRDWPRRSRRAPSKAPR